MLEHNPYHAAPNVARNLSIDRRPRPCNDADIPVIDYNPFHDDGIAHIFACGRDNHIDTTARTVGTCTLADSERLVGTAPVATSDTAGRHMFFTTTE